MLQCLYSKFINSNVVSHIRKIKDLQSPQSYDFCNIHFEIYKILENWEIICGHFCKKLKICISEFENSLIERPMLRNQMNVVQWQMISHVLQVFQCNDVNLHSNTGTLQCDVGGHLRNDAQDLDLRGQNHSNSMQFCPPWQPIANTL